MAGEEMISVKAKDYFALCEENEKLKKEVEKLRKKLDGGKKKKPLRETLDKSFVREDMMPVVDSWLDYKEERKDSYTPIGFKAFVKKLMEYSGGNVSVASQIVEESISNNWKGIFRLKNNAAKMPIGFVQNDNSQNKYKEQTLW